MSDEFVISADFGTSSVKVAVVDAGLNMVANAAQSYPLSLPGADRAEQDPEDWWAALSRAIAALSAEVPDLKNRVGALSICAQMAGVISVAKDGTALRPCIVCMDKRSSAIARDLIGGFPSFEGYRLDKLVKWLRLANGAPSKNGMDPPGKMLWIKQVEPEIYDRTHKFLDVKDWLILRATGRATMTADSANLTWMMDTRRGREGWSQSLIRQCGLDAEKLPEIVDGGEIVGTLTAKAAKQLGLSAATKVLGGGSDVSMSAIGAGIVDDGELMICASTSSWISGFVDRRIVNVSSSYATLTSSTNFRPLLVATQECAGSAADWAARTLSDTPQTAKDGLSAFYQDSGLPETDDPFFIPWMAGERVPVDDERLRGAFYRLSLRHDKQAIKRAVLEGIALNTAWAFSKVAREKDVKHDGPVPLVGGMGMYPVFVQNLANSLNRPIITGTPRFAGVLGAAALAAPVLGWADSVWDGARICRSRFDQTVMPNPAEVAKSAARQAHLGRVRKKLVKLYQSG
jgi:xylulokinase